MIYHFPVPGPTQQYHQTRKWQHRTDRHIHPWQLEKWLESPMMMLTASTEMARTRLWDLFSMRVTSQCLRSLITPRWALFCVCLHFSAKTLRCTSDERITGTIVSLHLYIPSRHCRSNLEAFYLRPVTVIAARIRPDRICWIWLPASSLVPFFKRRPGSYCAKLAWIWSGWPAQGLAKQHFSLPSMILTPSLPPPHPPPPPKENCVALKQWYEKKLAAFKKIRYAEGFLSLGQLHVSNCSYSQLNWLSKWRTHTIFLQSPLWLKPRV